MEWHVIRDDTLEHHGIDGMHWGERNGPPYPLSPAARRRLEKKDNKWAKRNYNKIYKNVFKNSRKEVKQLIKGLNEQVESKLKSGKVSYKFINAYNKGLAAIMNKNMQEIYSPSGKVVRWVAKRGELGVHMALADPGYDMNQVRNGVYGSGRIAYRKDTVGTA